MIVYFIHFNKSPQQGRSISTESHAALFTLSIAAIERTKTNCPGFITDGLLRVDIFKNKDGKYVVNEFESLDADYYGASSSHLKTCQTSSFLREPESIEYFGSSGSRNRIASANYNLHFNAAKRVVNSTVMRMQMAITVLCCFLCCNSILHYYFKNLL